MLGASSSNWRGWRRRRSRSRQSAARTGPSPAPTKTAAVYRVIQTSKLNERSAGLACWRAFPAALPSGQQDRWPAPLELEGPWHVGHSLIAQISSHSRGPSPDAYGDLLRSTFVARSIQRLRSKLWGRLKRAQATMEETY